MLLKHSAMDNPNFDWKWMRDVSSPVYEVSIYLKCYTAYPLSKLQNMQ